MDTSKTSLPPENEIEKDKDTKRKRSFVRVSTKKKKNSSGNSGSSSSRKQKIVVEPEVITPESDEAPYSSDDDDDIIDVGEPPEDEIPEAYDEYYEREPTENLPVVREPLEPELVDEDETQEISEEKGLVVSTGLQRYLAEIRMHSLLTPEEERATAFLAYEKGDINARNKLITSNLRLVVKIAMEYRRAYSQILDLIQEGNAGLVQAVNRFNPYRGVKLSTYSAWWIRAYILKFLMDNKSLVRMGTTDAQRKLFFRLRSEAEKMYALTQKFDARLLAENIGVKESDVIEMQQRLTKSDASLDAPLGEDGDARQVDTLVSEFDEPDVSAERNQLIKILRESVRDVEKELKGRDLFIFQNRIMADDPITLQDVGDHFSITRERARQLESRVLKKIKEKLVKKGIV